MIKKTLCAMALLGAAAAAQADVILQEGFNNVANLAASGWVQTNNSTANPGNTPWFQGNTDVFDAQSGAAGSYAAATWGSAFGGGSIDNWLISPIFSTAQLTVVSLWLRAEEAAGFSDHISFGVSNGSSSIADFALNPSFVANTDGWQKYTFSIAAQGAGSTARFAINYNGLSDTSDYVGIDSLEVNTVADPAAIPEPASLLLLGTGLLGLTAARRRRSK
jgi:hypothetical protein